MNYMDKKKSGNSYCWWLPNVYPQAGGAWYDKRNAEIALSNLKAYKNPPKGIKEKIPFMEKFVEDIKKEEKDNVKMTNEDFKKKQGMRNVKRIDLRHIRSLIDDYLVESRESYQKKIEDSLRLYGLNVIKKKQDEE